MPLVTWMPDMDSQERGIFDELCSNAEAQLQLLVDARASATWPEINGKAQEKLGRLYDEAAKLFDHIHDGKRGMGVISRLKCLQVVQRDIDELLGNPSSPFQDAWISFYKA